MNALLLTGSLTLVSVAGIAGTGLSQDVTFPKTPYPMGQVIDEAGEPVAGATIRVRVDHSAHFKRAVHDLLQRQPLVPVVSGRDGSYVLPLTEGQRHLTSNEANLSLVVEKDGYLPWVENLPTGLYGYLGSRVTLRRPRAEDRLSLKVQDPIPSMLLLVERVILTGQPRSAAASVLHPVPLDGRVETALSLTPNPPQFSSSNRSLPLRLEARILYPGRSTRPQAVLASSTDQDIVAELAPGGQSRVVSLQGGGTPQGLRGLYRCPDRRLRWFDLAGDRAPEDGALRLVAVVADGHLATTDLQEPKLRPLPEETARRILVRDRDGSAVPGVRAQLLGLESWTPSSSQPVSNPIGSRPIRRLRGSSKGVLVLPAEISAKPSYLLVEAPGHLPVQIVEPRGLESGAELQMQKIHGGSLALRIHGPGGKVVPGASLVFGDDAYGLGALVRSRSRTDREGRFELNHLPEGRHSIGVIADGFEPHWQSLTISTGEKTEVIAELTPIVEWRIVTVDPDGRPVPFAPLQQVETNENGRARSFTPCTSDSLGRLVLHHGGEQLSVQPTRRSPAMQFADPDRIHRAEIQSMPIVLVALEPDTSILQENWQIDGAISSRFTTTRRDGLAKVLMRWVGGRTATVCLIVDRGPPIRVQGTAVMEAWRSEPGQVVRVDRSQTTRRIPIAVRRDNVPIRDDFEVVYHPGGSTINLSLGQGKILEEGPDGMHLALRDDDELPCMLLHPEHQPLAFTVPEKDGPEKPLELRLEKGVPLSFDVTFDKLPSPNAVMTLRVRKRTAGTYLINTIADLPELAPEDLGKPIRIQCPAALPEGRFNVYLRIPGLPTLSADANLEEGVSVVLEVKPKSS